MSKFISVRFNDDISIHKLSKFENEVLSYVINLNKSVIGVIIKLTKFNKEMSKIIKSNIGRLNTWYVKDHYVYVNKSLYDEWLNGNNIHNHFLPSNIVIINGRRKKIDNVFSKIAFGNDKNK